MKKILTITGFILAAASDLHAEGRLFPTDILNQGEVDAQISVTNETQSRNVNLSGNPGRSSFEENSESIQMRYGTGSGWHIGGALPYKSMSVVNSDYNSPSVHTSNRNLQGEQNLNLWATYGFINDKTSRFSLNGEFSISPNTTGKQSTVYTGRLLSGWKNSDTLKLYGILSTSMSSDANFSNTNQVKIGAHKLISDDLTLIPHAGYTQFQGTDAPSALMQHNQYGMGLSANIQITNNSYLVPDVSFYKDGAADSNDKSFHRDATTDGRTLKLSFYHLF